MILTKTYPGGWYSPKTLIAENFNLMCDIKTEVESISIYLTFYSQLTDVSVAHSVIEWPCIYVNTSVSEFRIDLSLSQDEFVGFTRLPSSYTELYLPEHMIGDDICLEICSLWAILLNSNYVNCAVVI